MVHRSMPEAKGNGGYGKALSKLPDYDEFRLSEQCDTVLIPLECLKKYDVFLRSRYNNTKQILKVTEAQREPHLVDRPELIQLSKDIALRARSRPRAARHNFRCSLKTPQLKRKHSHRSLSSSSSSSSSSLSLSSFARKRQIPNLQADATPETSDEEDHVSDAEDELDAVLIDDKAVTEQHIEVDRLKDDYYSVAFRLIGQLGCKDLVKAWIKKCHPKKQTSNPYNGGKSKSRSMALYGFGGAYKVPDYWPPQEGWDLKDAEGCRHKEPDHIKKPERLILLRHLLRCGHPRFTLDRLRLATAQIECEIPDHFTAKSIKILKQIYAARAMEIRYEKGEIDGDATIPLYIPRPSAKAQSVSETGSSVNVKREHSKEDSIKQYTYKAPVVAPGIEPHVEKENYVTTQMLNGWCHQTELGDTEGRPISAVSSIRDAVNVQITRKEKPPMQCGMPITSPAASDPNQVNNQCSFAGDLTQHSETQRAMPKYLERLPVQRGPHAARKRALTARGNASQLNCDSLFQGKTKPQCAQGKTSAYRPGTKLWQGDEKSAVQSGHFRTSVAGQYCLPIKNTRNCLDGATNLPRCSVAPKPMTFSGSSSGLAGLPPDDSWSTVSDFWNLGHYNFNNLRSTESFDPGTFTPDVDSYASGPCNTFSSDFTDSSCGGGLQLGSWVQPLQSHPIESSISFGAGLQQQYSTSLLADVNTTSTESGSRGDSAFISTGLSISPGNKSFSNVQDNA